MSQYWLRYWIMASCCKGDKTCLKVPRQILSDHSRYGFNQWQTMLQSNVFSQWLSSCSEWSLIMIYVLPHNTLNFLRYPAAPWLPIPVIHIRSQLKTRQSQIYKFSKIAKNSNFIILQETLHVTHLLKLLDKMYKYKMDPIRTVGTAERTRDAGGLDRQMDGRTDEVKPIYPPTTSLCEGYNYLCSPKTIQYMRGQYWKQLQLGPMNPLLCMWTWG